MFCPVCASNLRETKVLLHLVDICPKCGGVWFDEGELQDFLKKLTESERVSPSVPQLFHERDVQTTYRAEEGDKACPKDGRPMTRFNYAYDSNVFLDKCPQCEGVWTDRGEVKKIVRYLKVDPKVIEIAKPHAGLFRTTKELEKFSSALKS